MTKHTKRPATIANCTICGGAFLRIDLNAKGICPSDAMIAAKSK